MMHVYNAIVMGAKAASANDTDSSFISQQSNLQILRYGFLVSCFYITFLKKFSVSKSFRGLQNEKRVNFP